MKLKSFSKGVNSKMQRFMGMFTDVDMIVFHSWREKNPAKEKVPPKKVNYDRKHMLWNVKVIYCILQQLRGVIYCTVDAAVVIKASLAFFRSCTVKVHPVSRLYPKLEIYLHSNALLSQTTWEAVVWVKGMIIYRWALNTAITVSNYLENHSPETCILQTGENKEQQWRD